MRYITDRYKVFYNDKIIGCYYVFSDHTTDYNTGWGCPWDMEDKLKELGLDKEFEGKKSVKPFSGLIQIFTVFPVYSKPARRLSMLMEILPSRISILRGVTAAISGL